MPTRANRTPAKSNSAPRTKPPEERRQELMNAAQRLFLAQGIQSTTVEQITATAGVAKGTFYLYFSCKEDVLRALGERYGQDLLAHIKVAVAKQPEKDWKGKLAAWARACVSGYLDSIRLHDIVFFQSHPRTREGLTDNVIIDYLSHVLEAGAQAGAWSIDEPRFTAVFLFTGLHALVDDAHGKEKRVNRVRLGQRVEKLCFRVVGLSLV